MSMLWVSLVLAMSGLLQTQAVDIPAVANFDPEKIAGDWYAVAAGSDCGQFLQMKPAMGMGKLRISNLENGDLDIALAFPMHDQCMTSNMHYTMIAPGHYTESEVAQSSIKFVEADYTEVALEYSELIDDAGLACIGIKMYARNPSVPPQAIPYFQKLMEVAGLHMENMALLMKGMDCKPEDA